MILGLLALLTLVALPACGVLLRNGGQPTPPPGKTLEAFARRLGVEVALSENAATEAQGSDEARFAALLATVDEKALLAYQQEEIQARALLVSVFGDSKPELDLLPAADTRVSMLARAMGLVDDLERDADGRDLLETILAEDPRHVIAHEVLARSLARGGQIDAAIAKLRALHRAFPAYASWTMQLGNFLLEYEHYAKDADPAMLALHHREGERLMASLVDGPLGIQASRLLAGHLMRRFQPERLETVLRKALVAWPKHPQLELDLAKSLRYQGKVDQALALLRPLTELGAEQRARGIVSEACLETAWCYRSLDRYSDALASLESIAADDATVPRPALDNLRKALNEEVKLGARTSFSSMELRYQLRKSDSSKARSNALRILSENAEAIEAVEEDYLYVLKRDSDAELRLAALAALLRTKLAPSVYMQVALMDSEAGNRKIAAGLARQLPRQDAARLLLDALGREEDHEVFRYLHEQLARATGASFLLERGAEATPVRRAKVLDEWTERLGMRGAAAASEPSAEQGNAKSDIKTDKSTDPQR